MTTKTGAAGSAGMKGGNYILSIDMIEHLKEQCMESFLEEGDYSIVLKVTGIEGRDVER